MKIKFKEIGTCNHKHVAQKAWDLWGKLVAIRKSTKYKKLGG